MPTGKTFSAETIELDGKRFVSCTFDHCTLIYRGGKLPQIEGNSVLRQCRISLEDGARRALVFLSILHMVGGEDVVDGAFEAVRSGSLLR